MRLFTDILRDIRRGDVVHKLSEALAEVVRAVLDTDKAGSITLTLNIKPRGKGDNILIIEPKVSTKLPQAELPDAFFYTNLDGDLLRDDPTQTRLFADTAEKHDPETGEVVAG